MSGAQEVRRVITDLLWPADPIYQHCWAKVFTFFSRHLSS
jgi:hypothetical protein